MRLSVLDQSPVREGQTGTGRAREHARPRPSRRPARLPPLLARRASRRRDARRAVARGADRAVAAATERIRVGSGGVMLPHYSPYKVAEVFGVLSGLHPGPHRPRPRPRVRHRPADDLRAPARPPPGDADDFPDQLAELLAYLNGTIPDDHPFARLRCRRPSAPTCGCSARRRSARSGPTSSASTTPSRTSSTRRAPTSAWPGAEGRRRLGARRRHRGGGPAPRRPRRRMTLLELRRGRLIPVPPPEKALAVPARTSRASTSAGGRRASSARPSRSAPASRRSRTPTARRGIVVTISHDHAARRRSYELLAAECGLTGARGECHKVVTKS